MRFTTCRNTTAERCHDLDQDAEKNSQKGELPETQNLERDVKTGERLVKHQNADYGENCHVPHDALQKEGTSARIGKQCPIGWKGEGCKSRWKMHSSRKAVRKAYS